MDGFRGQGRLMEEDAMQAADRAKKREVKERNTWVLGCVFDTNITHRSALRNGINKSITASGGF